MITLRQIYTTLFFIGFFFFSFNEFSGFSFLGEFKREAGAMFFITGFVFLCIEFFITKKISLPFRSKLFQIIVIFVIWCLLSTIINCYSVFNNYFKHTGGVERFIRQYFSLIMSCLIFFTFYWNVIRKMSLNDILYKIRKMFLYSLIFAFSYGFLETLVVYFGIGAAYPILKLFNYFPFINTVLNDGGRISAMAYEPPFLAIYLITVAGWMFSYILTEKKLLKYAPTFAVIFLTFFSGSRTGLLIVFFQLFLFLTMIYSQERFKKSIQIGAKIMACTCLILLLFNGQKITKAIVQKAETLDFASNLKKNISNKSRFGMQYASLQVFVRNPIAGVGFGQQTYVARYHYPLWATSNNYEFKLFYKNTAEPSFPPAYNLYTRILAELGIIGFLLFFVLILYAILQTKKIIKKQINEPQILAQILLISFVGLSINWLQIDTFRIYGFWLSVAILIKLNITLNYKNE